MKNTYRSYSEYEIAQYVLGIDMPEATRNGIQEYLAHDNAAAAKALKWESYFLGIVDAIPSAQPPDQVLEKIQLSLNISRAEAVVSKPINTEEDKPVVIAESQPKKRKHSQLIAGFIATLLLIVIVTIAIKMLNKDAKQTMVEQEIHLISK